MNRSVKPSHYRRFVNNMFDFSTRDTFPIFLNAKIDITKLLHFKKEKKIALSALLIKYISDTMASKEKYKPLNSIYKRSILGPRIHYFDNISVSMTLDRYWQNERVACTYILEDTNHKSLEEIDTEIKKTRELEIEDIDAFKQLKYLLPLPNPIQRFIFWLAKLFPSPATTTYGTISFSNVGNGSILSIGTASPKTLFFAIGGTEKQLVKTEDGDIEEHDFLTLNLSMNHYVVDGMLCNQYLDDLKRNIENIAP